MKNWCEYDDFRKEFSDEELEYMKNVPLDSEIEPLSQIDDDWDDGDEDLSDPSKKTTKSLVLLMNLTF